MDTNVAQDTRFRTAAPVGGTGTLRETFVGLLWLGISMYTAHATITGSEDGLSGAFGSAAAALPGVIAATLLTSTTIGHAASSRFRPAGLRLVVGLGVGVLFGLIAAAGIRFGYGDEPSIGVFAVTVGAAAVLGGAAAVLPNQVLEAALWATTWVFFAGVIFGVLQPNLMNLLGGGPNADPAAQATATEQFNYATSALTGLIAAYYSFRTLRAERPALPWFLVAGALPGLLLLAAEWLTRLGGTSLIDLVTGFTPDDSALAPLTDAGRLRHALIVIAVGGGIAFISALVTRGKDAASSSSSSNDQGDEEDED
jgi:hypothetical protein